MKNVLIRFWKIIATCIIIPLCSLSLIIGSIVGILIFIISPIIWTIVYIIFGYNLYELEIFDKIINIVVLFIPEYLKKLIKIEFKKK